MSQLEELKFELSALNEKMDNILSTIKKLDRKTEPYKKPKKVKIPGEPKKPLSAYFYYLAEVRDDYKDVKFGDRAKMISEKWKNLSDKSKYNLLAAKDKERYKEEKAKFDAEQGN